MPKYILIEFEEEVTAEHLDKMENVVVDAVIHSDMPIALSVKAVRWSVDGKFIPVGLRD